MAKSKKSNSSKSENKPKKSKEISKIEDLVELMNLHGVAELEWTRGSEKLVLKTTVAAPTYLAPPTASYHAPSGSHHAPQASQGATSAASTPAPAAAPSNNKQVLSPFVGTFYRAPSPNAPEYVREGQNVKKGDVVCIIEAMKLMNEIECEWAGKIISILVENGQPVEFGEPLFVIET